MEAALFTAMTNLGGMGVCTAVLFYLLVSERRGYREEHQLMMSVLDKHTNALDRITEQLRVAADLLARKGNS